MEIEIDTNHLLLALGILLIIGGSIYYFTQPKPKVVSDYKFSFIGEPVEINESFSSMLKAERIAIVMDARNANASLSREVYNCGAAYARSLGMLGKNISNYAVEWDYCVLPSMNETTLENCNQDIIENSDYVLYLYPSNTNESQIDAYSDYISMSIPLGGSAQCGIKFKNKS